MNGETKRLEKGMSESRREERKEGTTNKGRLSARMTSLVSKAAGVTLG